MYVKVKDEFKSWILICLA